MVQVYNKVKLEINKIEKNVYTNKGYKIMVVKIMVVKATGGVGGLEGPKF